MIQQPLVQTILNVNDGQFGLRYLKIVKSPTGPHFVVDVMFKKGFRITADVVPGNSAKSIGQELDSKTQQYRSIDYDEIKPAIEFVAECVERVLSDEQGKIAACQLHEDTIREAWEMTLFRRFLKVIDPRRQIEFEEATKNLESIYAAA
jgi:hypothetical protein